MKKRNYTVSPKIRERLEKLDNLILSYIKEYLINEDRTPTTRTIAKSFGFASQASAIHALRRLVAKGELVNDKGYYKLARKTRPCRNCNGDGRVPSSNPNIRGGEFHERCDLCGGKGSI